MSVPCNKCSRPRTERALALLVPLIVILTMTSAAQTADFPSNGLQPCPDSAAACVIESREFDEPSDVLFAAAIRAIDRISPASLAIAQDRTRLSAEFRIFLFRDDVDLVIERNGDVGSRLHIRSASRADRWDAGLNARRVRSFFKHLERVLSEISNQR
jgi:uncharacterized protein (DUF1499 family)